MKNQRLVTLTGSICLILVLAMSLLVIACAKPAPAPTSAPIILKISQFFIETDYRTKALQHFADVVNQKSGGRLSLRVFAAESLAKASEEFTMLGAGTIDMAALGAPYFAGKLPFYNATQLPFYTTLEQFETLANKTAPMFSKYLAENNIKYLYATSDGYMQLEHRSKFLKSPDDWKGQKMRMGGGFQSKIGQTLGAGVVSVASPEQYMALQTGTVDGTMTSLGSYMSYKLNEVATSVTIWNLLSTKRDIAINKGKWDSIPPDLQKVILDAAIEAQSYAATTTKDFENTAIDEIKKLGAKVYVLTPAEKATFVKALAPLYDEFASMGPDYKAFADTVRELQPK